MTRLLNIITDKVMLLNASALTLSFMEIEALLKIVLLIFSIIYTIVKMIKGVNGNEAINNWINDYFSGKNKNRENDK